MINKAMYQIIVAEIAKLKVDLKDAKDPIQIKKINHKMLNLRKIRDFAEMWEGDITLNDDCSQVCFFPAVMFDKDGKLIP